MPGEMKKISIRGSVMRQERRLFLSFLLTPHVPSTRVFTGTLMSGMLGNMRETLISRAHFSSNGETSRKSSQCLEKLSPTPWRTLITQTIVVDSKTVISVSMVPTLKIVSIVQICGMQKTVLTVSALSDVSLVMNSLPLLIAIKYTFPTM